MAAHKKRPDWWLVDAEADDDDKYPKRKREDKWPEENADDEWPEENAGDDELPQEEQEEDEGMCDSIEYCSRKFLKIDWGPTIDWGPQ